MAASVILVMRSMAIKLSGLPYKDIINKTKGDFKELKRGFKKYIFKREDETT